MSGENCLAGMKVLDLTQFEAGPSCTEALAWLGADVVKVENPGAGDPGRNIGRTDPNADALYFLQYNSNKRSAAVNLKDPRGLDLVKRLARHADVMIENFAPGAIERLGLGYDVIKAINPAIIYCQVKGFGKGSPFEKNLAFDMIAQATGGTMWSPARRMAHRAGRARRWATPAPACSWRSPSSAPTCGACAPGRASISPSACRTR